MRDRSLLLLLAAGALLATAPGRAESLYKLETRCSVAGGAPQACSVEAINEGSATLYRHRIGTAIATIRITDKPLRMEMWQQDTKQWKLLQSASARFSTNTVCFNGRELCVVNPNYLNSVSQGRPDLMAGRDLVKVHFDGTGRTNASCYDEGCELDLK
ncbi:hypothetical protein [Cyanobium sp. Morenito 9A2]|uniref:hypothetical protein n=1 Tax=Cyanobium sp. Morenito 9A2 TaxID=2823718 RepID=UPI0020CCFE49|nr:hypothetical protein [Cyanobium sp. Morenito 9A2]MCP9849606.1 hypothetical protein [Cyanobium sp. Morenito 9A2]